MEKQIFTPGEGCLGFSEVVVNAVPAEELKITKNRTFEGFFTKVEVNVPAIIDVEELPPDKISTNNIYCITDIFSAIYQCNGGTTVKELYPNSEKIYAATTPITKIKSSTNNIYCFYYIADKGDIYYYKDNNWYCFYNLIEVSNAGGGPIETKENFLEVAEKYGYYAYLQKSYHHYLDEKNAIQYVAKNEGEEWQDLIVKENSAS